MPGHLRFGVTTLGGDMVAMLSQYENGEVHVVRNDARTAKVSVSIYDPAVVECIKPLERMLKVWYHQDEYGPWVARVDIVFWGQIITPHWEGRSGGGEGAEHVEVNAHDPSLRLKHHYLHKGDAAVSDPVNVFAQVAADLGEGTAPAPDDFIGSVPVSHIGMRRLLDAAVNTPKQNALGIPDLGIIYGDNTHEGSMTVYASAHTKKAQPRDTTLTVASVSGFPRGGGTLKVGATLDSTTNYETLVGGDTVTYTGVNKDKNQFTGVTGWSGGGTLAAETAVYLTTGKKKRMRAERGDEVWQKMVDLSELPTGPDFELEPYEGVFGSGALGELGGDPAEYTGASGDFALTDSNVTYFTLDIDEVGFVDELHVAFWIEHARIGDLRIDLRSPEGTWMQLFQGNIHAYGADFGTGGLGSEMTIFDDNATNAIADATSADAPFVGYWQPNDSLVDAFQGQRANGEWKLKVTDQAAGTSGTLHRWIMSFHNEGNITPSPTPPYAKLNTYSKLDWREGGPRDKSQEVVFHYGFGAGNLDGFTYTPGGDLVRNYIVAVTANTGADGGTDPAHTAIKTNIESRIRYGTFVEWEAAGTLDTAADPAGALREYATYLLLNNQQPLQAFTLTPKQEGAEAAERVYTYMRHFKCGDMISVAARKGYLVVAATPDGDPLRGLITEVTLKQADAAGSCQTDLVVIPYVRSYPTSAGYPGTEGGDKD